MAYCTCVFIPKIIFLEHLDLFFFFWRIDEVQVHQAAVVGLAWQTAEELAPRPHSEEGFAPQITEEALHSATGSASLTAEELAPN
jgi:hypothetical protein